MAKGTDALRALAGTRPFVVRLNRFFWDEGETAMRRFLDLTDRFAAAGLLVELQLRYRPPAGHDGDVSGFSAWVREVVRRFGTRPAVVGVQVTNEVNLTFSPDSSDGSASGARDALIAGVIAAKDEARRGGFDQLKVGFNWFYRTFPGAEEGFWSYLGSHGGAAFSRAVDWVGLDIYPGTIFPPYDTPGGERDAVVNALSSLRNCFMPMAGLSATVPVYVEENGWPTGPGRTPERQRQALQTMVAAFDELRGTYGVSDYRWFNLRDADSSSPNFQQQFGLLRDDYTRKPAFDSYRALIARLGNPGLPGARVAPPSLLALSVRRHCRPVRLSLRVRGATSKAVKRVSFSAGRARVIDRRPPFRTVLRHPHGVSGRWRARARVVLRDGTVLFLKRTVRGCRSR